ncbi:MAG: flavodoxin family protein [Alphaproteobacteria bacterium]|nr:flavodoxin family protein [Alphaproteobacteria bacterium]
MARKILVLIGSPRIGGNTEKLADAFAGGAESKGHEVRTFHLGKTKVNGCLGCHQCYSTGRPCVQKDGMDEIYDAFFWADTIVLASPLYFWHVSSQLKAFIDRFQALGYKNDFKYPRKDVVLMMVGASKKQDMFDAVCAYYDYGIVKYFGWNDLGRILARRVLDRGEIEKTPFLDDARAFGEQLV